MRVRRRIQPITVLTLATIVPSLVLANDTSVATDEGEVLEEVIVLGRGESRQTLSVGSVQLEQLPAGTSPLKAIEKLPGVNFQSADPYGNYEWSTRISVRGFNQNQLGFTLDGVPLGDMSYGNHNGLHISRAIAPENLGRVTLSQGAGSLGTASSNNLGGTIEFFSVDLEAEPAGRVELMGGSDDAQRVFARYSTGELGALGTRLMLSGFDHDSAKWKGAGDQKQRQFNLKLLQPVGAARVTAFVNYSDRAEIDYQDLSYDILRRRGNDWDNFAPNWNTAVAAAQACAASNFSNSVACDDAYWNASGLREDTLGYLAAEWGAAESLLVKLTGYLHQNEGQGLWGTPYVPTPGGAPLSVRTTEYDIERYGAIARADWNLGRHRVNLGLWYETNDFTQARRFYGEPSLAAPTRSFTEFQRNPLLTQWEYAFDTETLQFHVQDVFSLDDTWRLNFGFKSLRVENSAATITGPNKTGSIEAEEAFLPQLGFTARLANGQEFFGTVSRNMRAFVSANTAGPFSTTAAGFEAIRNVLEPETATTAEVGWRFRAPQLEGVLTAYRVDFDDRLLAIQQGPGIVGNPAVLANVGGVTTNGVELALAWRPATGLTWFNSLAWNDSTYDNDFLNNGAVVPVGGRDVVDTPQILARSELGYDNGIFFGRVDGNFVDERFYTYLNDASADSYTLFNATVGYRFRDLGFLEELVLQGDVTNLADEDYISTIGSNGFVNSDLNGTSQTLLRGAPRQFFVSLKARF
jgi:iron complex outermembrane receptor protein